MVRTERASWRTVRQPAGTNFYIIKNMSKIVLKVNHCTWVECELNVNFKVFRNISFKMGSSIREQFQFQKKNWKCKKLTEKNDTLKCHNQGVQQHHTTMTLQVRCQHILGRYCSQLIIIIIIITANYYCCSFFKNQIYVWGYVCNS